MTLTNNNWFQKTAVVAVAGTFGLSHLWMIGLLANKEAGLPKFNLPVGQYSQYTIDASKDGYSITHRMNDPKVMEMREDVIVLAKLDYSVEAVKIRKFTNSSNTLWRVTNT